MNGQEPEKRISRLMEILFDAAKLNEFSLGELIAAMQGLVPLLIKKYKKTFSVYEQSTLEILEGCRKEWNKWD